MPIQLGALAPILTLTSERALRLRKLIGVGTRLCGHLLPCTHPIEAQRLTNAPEEDLPSQVRAGERILFGCDALPLPFFLTYFAHPRFVELFERQRGTDHGLPCELSLDSTELHLSGLPQPWITGGGVPWSERVSYATTNELDLSAAPAPQDPAFIVKSMRHLYGLQQQFGALQGKRSPVWQLLMREMTGIELAPGLWVLHDPITQGSSLGFDPARFASLHIDDPRVQIYRSTTVEVDRFVKIDHDFADALRSVQAEQRTRAVHELERRIRAVIVDRHGLVNASNDALSSLDPRTFLWQHYT